MKHILRAMLLLVSALGGLIAAGATEAQDYRIRAGDTLRIEVLEDPTLNQEILVLPNGQIAFPLVGTLQAGGRTLDQVRTVLTSALEPNFAVAPSVFVTVARLREPAAPAEPAPAPTIRVYVLGEVATPGLREVVPGTTLLQFLSQSGGLTRFAATRRIQLRRVDTSGQERVYPIDYRAIERGYPLSNPIVLLEGDVILVPERRLFE
jgi:polysaccharide biosynthesis/export protein